MKKRSILLNGMGLVLIWRGAWREEGADGIEARTPLKPGPYWCSELDWSE